MGEYPRTKHKLIELLYNSRKHEKTEEIETIIKQLALN